MFCKKTFDTLHETKCTEKTNLFYIVGIYHSKIYGEVAHFDWFLFAVSMGRRNPWRNGCSIVIIQHFFIIKSKKGGQTGLALISLITHHNNIFSQNNHDIKINQSKKDAISFSKRFLILSLD